MYTQAITTAAKVPKVDIIGISERLVNTKALPVVKDVTDMAFMARDLCECMCVCLCVRTVGTQSRTRTSKPKYSTSSVIDIQVRIRLLLPGDYIVNLGDPTTRFRLVPKH